jgi:transcriptional regulator with XRE-family HTH domain
VPKFECQFNSEKLYADLEVLRVFNKLSWRDLADQIGVSHSTLSRMKDGKHPTADGLAAIFHWTGFELRTYIIATEREE